MANDSKNSAPLPRIVIVGAGFGGLACAHALGNAPAQVTIVDRRNFHLFSPLLYQVATAVLSPGRHRPADPPDPQPLQEHRRSAWTR